MPLGFRDTYKRINEIAEIKKLTALPGGFDHPVLGTRKSGAATEGERLCPTRRVV